MPIAIAAARASSVQGRIRWCERERLSKNCVMGMTHPPLWNFMPILRVNQVTDYEGIDHQQNQNGGPSGNVGPASVAATGARCRRGKASWFSPDPAVVRPGAMTDSARL